MPKVSLNRKGCFRVGPILTHRAVNGPGMQPEMVYSFSIFNSFSIGGGMADFSPVFDLVCTSYGADH